MQVRCSSPLLDPHIYSTVHCLLRRFSRAGRSRGCRACATTARTRTTRARTAAPPSVRPAPSQMTPLSRMPPLPAARSARSLLSARSMFSVQCSLFGGPRIASPSAPIANGQFTTARIESTRHDRVACGTGVACRGARVCVTCILILSGGSVAAHSPRLLLVLSCQ